MFYIAYIVSGWMWILPVLNVSGTTSGRPMVEFLGNMIKDGMVFFMLFEIVFTGMFVFITKAPAYLLSVMSSFGPLMVAIAFLASLAVVAEHWNLTRFGYGSPTGTVIQVHVWLRDWLCMVAPMAALMVWCALVVSRSAPVAKASEVYGVLWLWGLPVLLLVVWPFLWWLGRRANALPPSSTSHAPPEQVVSAARCVTEQHLSPLTDQSDAAVHLALHQPVGPEKAPGPNVAGLTDRREERTRSD